LRDAERSGPPKNLTGAGLAAGFYANELLIKLLERRDPHPVLFAHYSTLIDALVESEAAGNPSIIEPALRTFELALLRELGFGINFAYSATDQSPVEPQQLYEYHLERGLVPVFAEDDVTLAYPGAVYTAIEQMDWSESETRRAAKRLLRYTLDHYLDGRELKTRKVYSAMLGSRSAD